MESIKTVIKLQNAYRKLPTIGGKTAERLAYATLNFSPQQIDEFILALEEIKSLVHHCPECEMFIDSDVCPICQDKTRLQDTLLVVSSQKSLMAFEKSQTYNGQYFVLNGSISPLKGVYPDDLNFTKLIARVKDKNIKEIIIATDPTMDGENTSLYIAKIFKNIDVKLTRLAYGLPMGANIDYLDALTLSKSIKGRQKIEGE